VNPLTPLLVLATNSVFCDPAIDSSEHDTPDVPGPVERMEAYRRERDVSKLVLRDDPKPTWFVCKPLAASACAKHLDHQLQLRAFLSAFVLGCHEVRIPGEEPMRPRKMAPERDGMTGPANENEWIDAVARRFGLETIYEVGAVIYGRARLPEGARGPFFYPAG
jgi:hypothetical protein